MLDLNEALWKERLKEVYFPVSLADVYVGTPAHCAKRYKAIVPSDSAPTSYPLAIVTNRYRLIRNQDAVELGFMAFEYIFGSENSSDLKVFNVLMSKNRGSFLADFTAPALKFPIDVRLGQANRENMEDHVYFIRIVNSYNKTRPVGLEVGICRWICRNGIIFNKQSIHLKQPHTKTREELKDQVEKLATSLDADSLGSMIREAYSAPLSRDMSVLKGVLQTLRLLIPTPNPNSRLARMWIRRCAALEEVSRKYELKYGKSAFAALQAASEWSHTHSRTSPIQADLYERRCGEMLESVMSKKKWPECDESAGKQESHVEKWSALSKHTNLENAVS